MATALVAAFGCYFMAFYANRPFAIAPYMGENAFIAFTVCKVLGFRWQTALAAIFIAGALFVLMTILRLRQWIVEGVPTSLRYSFAVGIGLFLTFIGLNETGLVTLGVPGAPVQAGHLTSHPALVAMFGFVLIAILVIRKVPGAILLGIVITAIVAFVAGTAAPPHGLVSIPPSVSANPVAARFSRSPDLARLSGRAHHLHHGLCGYHGHADWALGARRLSRRERTVAADRAPHAGGRDRYLRRARAGHHHRGRAYIESATGIEAGGRTGFTVLVTGTCFLLTLFFAPFVAAIPAQAYGPALIIVGLFMLAPITRIDFSRLHRIHSRLRRGRADGVHLQHRHRDLRRLCALSRLQAGRRKAQPTQARLVGADRAVVAVLRVLSV